MAKVKDSWSKPVGIPGLIGRKQIDLSMLEEGTVIPHEFYEDFAEANGGYELARGDKRDLTLLIEGKEYPARLESRTNVSEQWRIMYSKTSGIGPLLQARLQVSHKYLQEYRSLIASPDRRRLGVITDEAHAEYLDFYSTGTPFRYRVEIIRSADRVWDELKEAIGEGIEVKTLSQGATNRYVMGDDAIRAIARKVGILPREWFDQAWQTLVNQKYLTQQTMEGSGQFRSTAILTILSLLPYVEYITSPRVTLFLKTYHYTEEQLKVLLETNDQGTILFSGGNAGNPRTAFFLADQAREEDRLYGFRAEYGRFVFLGRYHVAKAFADELSSVPSDTLIEAQTANRTWIFQANPEKYDVVAAVKALPELHWLVNRHSKEIKPGDTVYLWVSGDDAGIVAETTVLTKPGPAVVAEEELPYYVDGEMFEGDALRVRLRIDRVMPQRITRRQLMEHPVLKDLIIIRAPFNTNYAVTQEQAEALLALIEPEVIAHPIIRIGLSEEQQLSPDSLTVEWDDLCDLRSVTAFGDFVEEVARVHGPRLQYRRDAIRQVAAELWALRQVRYDTTVIATRGDNEIVAEGTVTGLAYDTYHDGTRNLHTYEVRWDYTVARRVPRVRHWANSRVSELTETEYEGLVQSDAPRLSLAEVAQHFGEALKQSHIQFGSRHDEVVRSFVASLATKRMAILTGLSGSGKTQIALRFGQWFGADRYLIVPVRPDWTGPEALLGYEDALQKGADGRPCWQVPEALAFMLRAAEDPYNPYLLVLDEMNLAHVERYFADVLSGMESGEPVLPNLAQDAKGKWQTKESDAPVIPYPDNLFVVGTVNVDETTYMFSPKVLDRANTFEFRVDTDDLIAELRSPAPCPEGPVALTRGFLAMATDPEWHLTQAPPVDHELEKLLKRVHALLSEGGFEFGHRVFREAIRFAAILLSAGQDSLHDALDLQIFQKVLPRLHGTRKRLEPTLCALGQFCYELDYQKESVMDGSAPSRFNPLDKTLGKAKLHRSFDKIRRMTRSLRANQFTSFTEQ